MKLDYEILKTARCSSGEKIALFGIIAQLAELGKIANREGLLSLDNSYENCPLTDKNIMFNTGINMITSSIDPQIVENIFYNKIASSDETGFNLLKKIIIAEGLLLIQRGENHHLIRAAMVAYLGDEFFEKYQEYFNSDDYDADIKSVYGDIHPFYKFRNKYLVTAHNPIGELVDNQGKIEGEESGYLIGENIYIYEDEIFAGIDGDVVIIDETMNVLPVCYRKGDISRKSENVNYIGSVVINGDVLPEFEVKAGGNIYISGIIRERADVKAEGKIIYINKELITAEVNRIFLDRGLKKIYLEAMEWIKAAYTEEQIKDPADMFEMIKPYKEQTGVSLGFSDVIGVFLLAKGEWKTEDLFEMGKSE